jgi:hypothetical protein
MKDMSAINKHYIINNQRISTLTELVGTSIDFIKNNPVFEIPASKDGKTF